MDFEWDEAKAAANLEKHGVSMRNAILALLDPAVVVVPDLRFDYGEDRWIAFGHVMGRSHVVVYTVREDTIRIISARRANKRERKAHGHRSHTH